jgi:hypothetical protein
MSRFPIADVYESTRRTAAATGTWRLRRWARRVRRALERDSGNDAERVRLTAIEKELVSRGVLTRGTLTPP